MGLVSLQADLLAYYKKAPNASSKTISEVSTHHFQKRVPILSRLYNLWKLDYGINKDWKGSPLVKLLNIITSDNINKDWDKVPVEGLLSNVKPDDIIPFTINSSPGGFRYWTGTTTLGADTLRKSTSGVTNFLKTINADDINKDWNGISLEKLWVADDLSKASGIKLITKGSKYSGLEKLWMKDYDINKPWSSYETQWNSTSDLINTNIEKLWNNENVTIATDPNNTYNIVSGKKDRWDIGEHPFTTNSTNKNFKYWYKSFEVIPPSNPTVLPIIIPIEGKAEGSAISKIYDANFGIYNFTLGIDPSKLSVTPKLVNPGNYLSLTFDKIKTFGYFKHKDGDKVVFDETLKELTFDIPWGSAKNSGNRLPRIFDKTENEIRHEADSNELHPIILHGIGSDDLNSSGRLVSTNSRELPIQSAKDDLERVGKFLVSTKGILFLAKQTALNLLNPTRETRAYNPLSVIENTVPTVNINRHMQNPFVSKLSAKSLFSTLASALGFGGDLTTYEGVMKNEGDNGEIQGRLQFAVDANIPLSVKRLEATNPNMYSGLSEWLSGSPKSIIGIEKYKAKVFSGDIKTFSQVDKVVSSGGIHKEIVTSPLQKYCTLAYGNLGGIFKKSYAPSLTPGGGGGTKESNFSSNSVLDNITWISDHPSKNFIGKKGGYNLASRFGFPEGAIDKDVRNRRSLNEDSVHKDHINILDYGESQDDNDVVYEDFIPFIFYDISLEKSIQFRAMLTGLEDGITPTWNAEKYIGNPMNMYVYDGVTRDFSFSWRVAAFSHPEMKYIYRKLNYLIGLAYPQYIDKKMVGPFIKLTLGDLWHNTPGILTSLRISYFDDMPWEIDTAGGTLLQVPMGFDISTTFVPIYQTLPDRTQRLIEYNETDENADWIPRQTENTENTNVLTAIT